MVMGSRSEALDQHTCVAGINQSISQGLRSRDPSLQHFRFPRSTNEFGIAYR